MNRENIAKVAHQINLAYCASMGDTSQPQWDDAPEWQKLSVLAGVDMHLANPDASPEQSHESWLAQKLADGWVHGEVKDAEAKTHPCCVPYDDLPQEQKAKDYLFRAVVHALRDEPDPVATLADPAALNAQVQPDKAQAKLVIVGTDVGVRYIGRRVSFVDSNYGTGLSFEQGQVRVLPALMARKFLRHADQFEEATADAVQADDQSADDGTDKALEDAAKRQKEQVDEQNAVQDVRDQVMQMTKKSLEEYALTKYQQNLDAAKKVGELRLEVLGFIDRFGIV